MSDSVNNFFIVHEPVKIILPTIKSAISKTQHVNKDAYKEHCGVDAFNFEKEKQNLIENLDWLKSLSVEEFTFYKKWEEMRYLLNNEIIADASTAKGVIWNPTDINDEIKTIKEIQNLQPTVVVAESPEQKRLWTALRYYCHTGEYNQAPGRFIRFFMIDQVSGKILGFASIASDVIAISDRDTYLGWTSENRLKDKKLANSTIGTTIAPTQPLGYNFLGGKLIACLLTTKVVRDYWTSNDKCGTDVLVGMTTTSLYGSNSMYNSLKWWHKCGSSKGKIPIKSDETHYKLWHTWLKENREKEYNEAMTQKEGIAGPVTGAKMRVLNMIFSAVGIKQSDYMHGFQRGVYYSCFYENTKEFLCNKIKENALVLKPLIKEDIQGILKWWKPHAIERYKKLKNEERLKPEKLFYDKMINLSYEDAKKEYFNDVGR